MLYVLDANGVEIKQRQQPVLCSVRDAQGKNVTKRQAERLLQPRLDVANASARGESQTLTFTAFAEIWVNDYLILAKPSTRSGMTGHVQRLKTIFGDRQMRSIGAGDVQRLVTSMNAKGMAPKTIRNVWGVISMIWAAALAQKYVDAVLPKPKLPRNPKKNLRCFTIDEVARIIGASEGEHRLFFWLLAESGIRAGEIAGLRLIDIGDEAYHRQSIGLARRRSDSEDRQLGSHNRLFARTGHSVVGAGGTAEGEGPRAICSLLRLVRLGIWMCIVAQVDATAEISRPQTGGLHALRHFNVALLDRSAVR